MIFNLILLFLVFYFPAKNGAHRWIQIPFFGNFQPAELTKVVLVLFMARFLDLHRSKIISYKKELWILLAVIFVFCILIMFQPDIGTPLLIMSVLLIILFISSMKKDFFLKILFISFLLIFFGFLLKPYRIERLKAMIDPWKYQSKVGYQLIQSYLSLARGHFSGCGLGNGIFKEYYLPEAHTDFIFCMIGEELGFIGTTLLVLIYSIMCFLGISVAYKLSSSKNFYGGIIVLGLTFNIVLQAYISISMTLGLLPTKGMGLPFVSYGGSSMIINFLSIGIILNMAQRIR
jgi:cell division protein FtsW